MLLSAGLAGGVEGGVVGGAAGGTGGTGGTGGATGGAGGTGGTGGATGGVGGVVFTHLVKVSEPSTEGAETTGFSHMHPAVQPLRFNTHWPPVAV